MRLNCIAGGLITEVYDEHDKKVGAVTMSKHPHRALKPFSDGKEWHPTYQAALLSLLKRKKVNIKL